MVAGLACPNCHRDYSFYREAVLVRVHHLLASAPKELPQ